MANSNLNAKQANQKKPIKFLALSEKIEKSLNERTWAENRTIVSSVEVIQLQ